MTRYAGPQKTFMSLLGFLGIALFLLCTSVSSSYAISVTLEWDKNPESSVSGYRVFYKSGSAGPPYNGTGATEGPSPLDVVGSGTTSYTLHGLSGTTVYYFSVTAVDDRGIESDYSDAVNNKAPQITSSPTVTYLTNDSAIIEWDTDKPSISQVLYGISTAYGSIQEAQDVSTALTAQSLTWSGSWVPNSLAGLEVKPDLAGNTTYTVVSNTAQTLNTDPADGDMTNGGKVPAGTKFGVFRSHHVITLSGLAASTLYHFQSGVTDVLGSGLDREAGDANPSADYTFTTSSEVDLTAPVLTSAPTVIGKTDTTATIQWKTDEISTSVVQFGPETSGTSTWGTYPSGVTESAFISDHVVTLTGLTAGNSYDFRVGSTDPANNGPTYSDEFSFTTDTTADNTAPQITSAPTVVSKTDSTATIKWTTDEPGDSVVEYGTSISYGSSATLGTLVINHSVILTGLNPNTTYYFRASSMDAAGNGPDTSVGDNNPVAGALPFTTDEESDTTPPVITEGPTAGSITNQQAVITWKTDEAGNSRVEFGPSSSDWGAYPANFSNATPVTTHSITITGLSGNTTYYFRVGSTDTSSNGPTVSNQVSFNTAPDPDTEAPQITTPPAAVSVTNSSAVIEWETDEVGNSLVRYGTSQADWGTYSTIKSQADSVTSHSVTLTNLFSGTTYYFRVGSRDSSGNGPETSDTDNNPSSEVRFSTLSAADTTAPQITSPPTITALTDSTAVIQFTTDEPGNSVVKYGTTQSNWEGYPDETSKDENVTNHYVTLTGLQSGTSYYFRVGSVDPAGNGPDKSTTDKNPSNEVNFLTLSASDSEAPRIISPASVVAKTDTTALIEWVTDEPANSVVRYGEDVSGTSPWSGYPLSRSDSNMVINHRITLTGLTAFITYAFQVGSTDPSGNGPDLNSNETNPSDEVTFQTSGVSDTIAPQMISAPTVTAKTDTTATIEWTTDEPGNSLVQYGTTSSAWDGYDSLKSLSALGTKHIVTLIGLGPSTVYYFRVGSVDAVGNGPGSSATDNNPSGEVNFTTDAEADTVAPEISGVTTAAVTDATAVIKWTTDEPGTSLVQYGNGTGTWGGYVSSKSDGNLVTAHTVTLTGLSGNTTYNFRVGSTDGSGNGPDFNPNVTNPSPETSFKTASGPDDTPPVITNISAPTYLITDTTAVIQWTTNELSNSAVQYGEDQNTHTWGTYPLIRTDTAMVTSHSVTLTGLSATTYYYRVGSTDISGNSAYSTEEGFGTSGVSDTTAPNITDVDVDSLSGTTAIITWTTTDDPSNSEVRYGTSSSSTWANYAFSKSNADLVINHSVTLTGLDPGTTYWLRVGSTDSFGNGPVSGTGTNNPSAALSFQTESPDLESPLISGATVDYSTNTISISYNESFMKNAATEANYAFSPTLLFASSAGDIIPLGGSTYRLFMSNIPDYTIFYLTLSNVTDDAGNEVANATAGDPFRINDNDKDGMADDWEVLHFGDTTTSNGVSNSDSDALTDLEEFQNGTDPKNADTDLDGMPDDWEVRYGLDPLVDSSGRDADNDGFTDLAEYLSGSNPTSAASQPITVKEVMPPSGSTNVPVDTAFAFRIESYQGVDTDGSGEVTFHIDETGVGSYTKNLDNAGVAIVELESIAAGATNFWAQYAKAADPSAGTSVYAFDKDVAVSIHVTDKQLSTMSSVTYTFHTETLEAYNETQSNLPTTTSEFVSGSSDYYTIELTDSGVTFQPLQGAMIVFNINDGGVTPYFGPVGDAGGIPAFNVSGAVAVGIPVNLEPTRIFPSGVSVFIPCPGYTTVGGLYVYGYTGTQWIQVCDSAGNVHSDAQGWMVPGSRMNVNNGSPSGIWIGLHHFSALIAGLPPAGGGGAAPGGGGIPGDGSAGDITGPEHVRSTKDGGGACFISTLL